LIAAHLARVAGDLAYRLDEPVRIAKARRKHDRNRKRSRRHQRRT
jgi:hypothetical protein